NGLLLVTVHPEHVAPDALRRMHLVLAIGKAPLSILHSFARAADVPPPKATHAELADRDLTPGHCLLWDRRSDAPPRLLTVVPTNTERLRHVRRYAEGDLGVERSFFFRGPQRRLNLRANNLTRASLR